MSEEQIVIYGMYIILLLVGGALGYFIQRTKGSGQMDTLRSELQQEIYDLQNSQSLDQHKIETLQQDLKRKEHDLSESQMRIDALQQQLTDKTAEVSSLKSAIEGHEKQEAELKGRIKELDQEIAAQRDKTDVAAQEKSEIARKLAEFKSSLKERDESFARERKNFDELKENTKKDFENLANQILEIKGKSFAEQSQKSMEHLLNPFREQVKSFQEKVEDIHHKDTKQQAEMKSEILQMQKTQAKMSEEAHRLSTALRGQKKVQGNWGELVLENVLDGSGLQQGKDYKREVSFNTEEGRKRPDVIVYLPDNKHLVIDAKVSLEAYTQYVNADDESERVAGLQQHVANVSDRINELSDKNYFQIPEIKSPEVVVMFVPIESAFVEAVKADSSLLQRAIENKVLVATPTTLLASLNIVRQLWRFEDQNKHTAELADKAGKVYDKLRNFVSSMESVGKSLDKARESYDTAYGQLYSGRGNLIKQANEFKELGVSVKAELPPTLIEKAHLELTHQADTVVLENE